jgi:hypothetical protein
VGKKLNLREEISSEGTGVDGMRRLDRLFWLSGNGVYGHRLTSRTTQVAKDPQFQSKCLDCTPHGHHGCRGPPRFRCASTRWPELPGSKRRESGGRDGYEERPCVFIQLRGEKIGWVRSWPREDRGGDPGSSSTAFAGPLRWREENDRAWGERANCVGPAWWCLGVCEEIS